MKHSYAAVRCRSCGVFIILKYLGPQDGSTIYTLLFPPEPIYAFLNMRCGVCGAKNQFLRTDMEYPIRDEAPPSDFYDQLPLTSVVKAPDSK